MLKNISLYAKRTYKRSTLWNCDWNSILTRLIHHRTFRDYFFLVILDLRNTVYRRQTLQLRPISVSIVKMFVMRISKSTENFICKNILIKEILIINRIIKLIYLEIWIQNKEIKKFENFNLDSWYLLFEKKGEIISIEIMSCMMYSTWHMR